jgi:protein-tyrosine-phosphatase
MKILFICKHNILRSRIAEEYFKKINKDNSIKVESAGVKKEGTPLYEIEKEVAKEFELDLSTKRKIVNQELLDTQDLVILVADNVDPDSIKANKLIIWKIEDGNKEFGKERVRKIFSGIIKKVDSLVESLKEVK